MAAKFTKNLTDLLNKVGSETHTVDNDNTPITKDEALIRLLWNTALGYIEKTMDDNGKEKTKKHPPQKWAMELIYNRKEGGIAGISEPGKRGTSARKRVSDLAKKRFNKAAKTTPNGE